MTPEELEQQSGTLKLINMELSARLTRLSEDAAKIDTKAIVLVGYTVAASSFLATRHAQPVLTYLAFAAYAIAVGFGIWAFAVGSYRDVPNPRRLLGGYAQRSEAETLAFLGVRRVKAFEHNQAKHERKAGRWRISLYALAIGVVLMVAAVTMQTGHHDRPAGHGEHIISHPRVGSAATSRRIRGHLQPVRRPGAR